MMRSTSTRQALTVAKINDCNSAASHGEWERVSWGRRSTCESECYVCETLGCDRISDPRLLTEDADRRRELGNLGDLRRSPSEEREGEELNLGEQVEQRDAERRELALEGTEPLTTRLTQVLDTLVHDRGHTWAETGRTDGHG